MANEFAITISGDKALVASPYNPDFVAQVKAMGGRWDSAKRCWAVNAQAADAVRQVMREVYGRDDSTPAPSDLVTVVVEFTRTVYAYQSAYMLFGRMIAKARGRDSGARVGNNVAFIRGRPTSCGSAKKWGTEIPEDSIVELYNIPRAIYLRDLPSMPADHPTLRISIKDTAPVIDRAALEAEKTRLLTRVAEIDALLGGENHEHA